MPALKYNTVISVFYLLLITFVGLVIAMVAMAVLLRGGSTTAMLRVATMIQDLFVFILPPVIMAMLITRQPARLLEVDRLPSLTMLAAALATLMCAVPALNWIVEWNESLTLPSSLAGIEAWMRQAEEAAASQVEILLGRGTVADLIMNLFVVGVMAGLSEEIFFRGGLQRLLSSSRLGHHGAIWITAIVFSAFHVQFFGFFPRMLLGAFFGYLLYWSGSLWLPITLHAANNSAVVVSEWLEKRNGATASTQTSDFNSWGADSVLLIIASIILTASLLHYLHRNSHSVKEPPSLNSQLSHPDDA